MFVIRPRMLVSCLKRKGVKSEWKAFSALAVEWLGGPVEVIAAD